MKAYKVIVELSDMEGKSWHISEEQGRYYFNKEDAEAYANAKKEWYKSWAYVTIKEIEIN